MTTDDVTHLRALLADATARAEKAEAERDQALAANAEMRAALEIIASSNTRRLGESRRAIEFARALLARTDLGAGKVLVEREVLEKVRAAMDQWLWLTDGGRPRGYREMVADLDALLKKGGG